ncbi:MAG: hypothetical protein QXF61_07950 [Nitrososphaeria archaeon]
MSFISGLSEAGKKAYHFILRGLTEGLSGTEILKILREHGLGYRLSNFYNDLRILKGETTKWDTIKYVPRDKVISDKLYTPTELTGLNKYITICKVEYVDVMTGEKRKSHIAVGHDAPLRRKDIEEMAEETINYSPLQYLETELYEVISIKPVRGFKRV